MRKISTIKYCYEKLHCDKYLTYKKAKKQPTIALPKNFDILLILKEQSSRRVFFL